MTTQFHLGDTLIETCDNYTYLGTAFSWNGSSKKCTNVLQEKASKSMYGLLSKIFKFRSCDLTTACRLIDGIVKPVLCYNSEVWGSSLFLKKPRFD